MKKAVFAALALILTLSGCAATQQNTNTSSTQSADQFSAVDKIHQNITAFDKFQPQETELGKVIELDDNGSIYYKAANGKRYIFPTPETYASWFKEYKPATKMTLEVIQKIPLGGNVTIRPGSLIKTESDPRTYIVTAGGIIRSVSPEVIKAIYTDKKPTVYDIPNYYFTNYAYGDPVTTVDEFPITNITLTIDEDKGFNAQ